MKSKTIKTELLAPAKDLECGIAAINCGADAVYIGSPRFGAREAAGNSLEDIEKLVQHAHKYWAKVYVTLNTLLYDDEIPHALRLIGDLHNAGIDGLIIQDVGLLECDSPPIPLIASTQMHNNTPEKVAFLEKVGFQRVILARELSLQEIQSIREQTSVELESFVHGALCVGYSGQCYLSYALGGRSGNRGQCAQPCRKLYSLIDGSGKAIVRDKHLLSLRDLNLSGYLSELLAAGISSFKIEGRLKDKTYVSNIVAYYRSKLDEVLSSEGITRSSSGTSRIDFDPNPDKTFNRGYCTYFLNGQGESVGSLDTPKMVGEPVGKVISVSRRSITLDSAVAMHKGDGICFFDRSGELRGSIINDVQGKNIFPDKMDGLQKDIQVYRNHDHEFLMRLKKSSPERLIKVTLAIKDTEDGFELTAADEDGNTSEFAMPCEKMQAEKPDQALVNIQKQLVKSGGTEFECTDVNVELSQPYFLPISILNTLRRGALEALSEERQRNRPKIQPGTIDRTVPYHEKKLSYFGNVLNKHTADFYKRHGVTEIEPAAESGIDLHGRQVMTTRYCIKHQLGLCPRKVTGVKIPQPRFLVDEEGHKLELRFDCVRCEMNIYLK